MAGRYLSVGDEVWLNGKGRTEEVATIKLPDKTVEEIDWNSITRGGKFVLLTTTAGTKVYANEVSRWN